MEGGSSGRTIPVRSQPQKWRSPLEEAQGLLVRLVQGGYPDPQTSRFSITLSTAASASAAGRAETANTGSRRRRESFIVSDLTRQRLILVWVWLEEKEFREYEMDKKFKSRQVIRDLYILLEQSE